MPVQVIAEAGVNHNGSLEMAVALVDAAHAAGADCVKFQTFSAARLVSSVAPKAEYQLRSTDAQESQLTMLRRLELDEEAHLRLMGHCRSRGIEFLSSPFDFESVDLLARLGLQRLKIGSGEITNAPLLLRAARTGLPVILSTGMSTLADVELALGALAFGYLTETGQPSADAFQDAFGSPAGRDALVRNVSLLHCTTEYPTPFEEVNLRVLDTLAAAFGLPVGLSDHTPGIAIPIAAVARGAVMIEKHVTLDRRLPGPDHKASLEPSELEAMVSGIRAVESALGDGVKRPAASEMKNRRVARKSLVTTRPVRRGETFTEDSIAVKRPGTGLSPFEYWNWIGRQADRDYAADEVIGT